MSILYEGEYNIVYNMKEEIKSIHVTIQGQHM